MNKEQLIQEIKNSAAQKLIKKDEIIAAYNEGAGVKKDRALTRHIGISEILYYIGGAIVFIGIAVLIGQNFDTLNNTVKILVTLGSGLLAYIIGIIFCRKEKLNTIGQAFYFISALVLPIGLYVIFDMAGLYIEALVTQSLISGIILIFYLLSYLIFKKNIFIIFSIIFGTILFVTLTSYFVDSNPNIDLEKFSQYQLLTVGLTFMLLGYLFSRGDKKFLVGPLYGFGSFFFLGSALILGGWPPEQNVFWEVAFPFLVFGVIFLSVYLKSKALLTFGSIFLMGYILKITSEYFAEGLGWPISLMIGGLLLIFIGYFTLRLKKKYFT